MDTKIKSVFDKIDFENILNLEDLNQIIFLYNGSEIVQRALDKPENFEHIQKRFNLYSGYINSISDLALFENELKKSKVKTVDRAGMKIVNFEPGDRVIFDYNNCVIDCCDINEEISNIILHEVDLFGRSLGNETKKEFSIKNSATAFPWDRKGLQFGIVLCKDGPIVENINSVFLKYKFLFSSLQESAKPEVNMIVSVKTLKTTPQESYAYVIESIVHTELSLIYLDRGQYKNGVPTQIPNKLIVRNQQGNEWDSDLLGKTTIVIGSTYEFVFCGAVMEKTKFLYC